MAKVIVLVLLASSALPLFSAAQKPTRPEIIFIDQVDTLPTGLRPLGSDCTNSTATSETKTAEITEINKQDDNGNTPLMIAILKKDIATATLLLRRGADKSIKNKEGKTALSLALAQHHPLFRQAMLTKLSKADDTLRQQLWILVGTLQNKANPI